MKIENRNYELCLCLWYKKSIDLSKKCTLIQPGDLEIANNGGCFSKYIVLGLPDDNPNDDAGYLIFGTFFKSSLKEWMKNNNLTIGEEFGRSELMEFHGLYNYLNAPKQWKVFELIETVK